MKIKRFSKQKRSKLIPKRDGPFQILEDLMIILIK
jgi:hypothetical protein